MKKAKTTDTNQLTSIQKKRQVNLRWNHTRNFQIGLILSILFVIIVVESVRVEIKEVPLTITEEPPEEVYLINDFRIEQVVPKTEPVAKVEPVKRVTTVVQVVKNDYAQSKMATLVTDPPVIKIDPGTKITTTGPKKKKEEKPLLLDNVSQIPIFPGCDSGGTRTEQIRCLTRQLHKFIGRKFDTEIAADQGLYGEQRIYCNFTIDAQGNIVNIRATAKNKALEREAAEVLSKVPQMEPGKNNGKAVAILFNLPISFQVQD